jgi:hypothetical protein
MKTLLLIVAILNLQGCATMVNGSKHNVDILSEPAGAQYIVTGNGVSRHGVTPARETLAGGAGYFKRASYTVSYSKDGFSDTKTVIKPTVSGWYWFGLAMSAVSGLVVDPLTGGMWRMPEAASVEMKTNQGAAR